MYINSDVYIYIFFLEFFYIYIFFGANYSNKLIKISIKVYTYEHIHKM